jgi:hypothetical protein
VRKKSNSNARSCPRSQHREVVEVECVDPDVVVAVGARKGRCRFSRRQHGAWPADPLEGSDEQAIEECSAGHWTGEVRNHKVLSSPHRPPTLER